MWSKLDFQWFPKTSRVKRWKQSSPIFLWTAVRRRDKQNDWPLSNQPKTKNKCRQNEWNIYIYIYIYIYTHIHTHISVRTGIDTLGVFPPGSIGPPTLDLSHILLQSAEFFTWGRRAIGHGKSANSTRNFGNRLVLGLRGYRPNAWRESCPHGQREKNYWSYTR